MEFSARSRMSRFYDAIGSQYSKDLINFNLKRASKGFIQKLIENCDNAIIMYKKVIAERTRDIKKIEKEIRQRKNESKPYKELAKISKMYSGVIKLRTKNIEEKKLVKKLAKKELKKRL